MASVLITLLLYNGPFLCGCRVPVKGELEYSAIQYSTVNGACYADTSDVVKASPFKAKARTIDVG